MDPFTFVLRILISAALGGIIGSERERTMKQRIVGLRTFALVSLLGTFFAIFSSLPIPFSEIFPLIGLISIIFYTYYLYRSARLKIGVVTLVVLPLVYLVGLLVGFDYSIQATASTFLILAVLVIGRWLHKHVECLKEGEVNEIIQFGLILFVIYPLLPKSPVIINGVSIDFFMFFLIILFLSIINFAAFFVNRIAKKATMISGLLGGIINSTATIYYFGKISREKNENFSKGAAAAIAGSILRNSFLVAIL